VLGSAVEAAMILTAVPIAFVGGILALLIAQETWNVSSLVGLIGLFGIAVQNSLVLVTQSRGLLAAGRPLREAVREASIGRVRPKLMTAGTAILGLLPLLVLQLHGTEIERPLAIVMIGGLATSTLFTLLVLPRFICKCTDGSSAGHTSVTRPPHDTAMRLRKPDFATVLVILLALVILAVLTFELWMPHPSGH
jgi:Cu/Ag efflux pump CusA